MRLNRVLAAFATTMMCLVLLASTTLVLAQETTQPVVTAEPAAEFQGVGTLFLLLGLGALGLVAIIWLARERAAHNGDDAA